MTKIALGGFDFNLPRAVGRIDEKFVAPGSDKALILIQDAHTNPSAQLNIAKSIDLILSRQAIRHVFLEAGRGNDSLAYLRRFAEPKKREEVARSFLNRGLIQGPDYLDLTSEKNFSLWGVENKKLYWEELRIYRDLKKNRSFLNDSVGRLKRAQKTLSSSLLNPSLSSLLRAREDFMQGRTSSMEYLEKLIFEAHFLGLPMDVFPHLENVESLRQKEARLNFEKISSEQAALIATLPPGEQKQLLDIASSMHGKNSEENSEIRSSFYSLLKEKIKVPSYPELSKYIDTILESRAFSTEEVLKEEKDLEGIIFTKLTRTQQEGDFIAASKALGVLEKLVNLELTGEECTGLLEDARGHSFLNLAGYFNLELMKSGAHAEDTFFWDEKLAVDFQKALRFYELASERDQAFLENTFKKMKEASEKKAILVTGGFHTQHLKAMLRQRGISYSVVVPGITQETNKNRYEDLLLGQLDSSSRTDRSISSDTQKSSWALEPAAELRIAQERVCDSLRRAMGGAVGARLAENYPNEISDEIRNLVNSWIMEGKKFIGDEFPGRPLSLKVVDGKVPAVKYELKNNELSISRHFLMLLTSEDAKFSNQAKLDMKIEVFLAMGRELLRQGRDDLARSLIDRDKEIGLPPVDDPEIYKELAKLFVTEMLSGLSHKINANDLVRAAIKLKDEVSYYPYSYASLRGLSGYILDGVNPDSSELDLDQIWAPWDLIAILKDVYFISGIKDSRVEKLIEDIEQKWNQKWTQFKGLMKYDEFYEVSVNSTIGCEADAPKTTDQGVEFNLRENQIQKAIYDEFIRLAYSPSLDESAHGRKLLEDICRLLDIKTKDPLIAAEAIKLYMVTYPERVYLAGNFLKDKPWGVDPIHVGSDVHPISDLHDGWNAPRSATYSESDGWKWVVACEVPPSAFREPKELHYKFVIRLKDGANNEYNFWLPDPSVSRHSTDGGYNSVLTVGPRHDKIFELTDKAPSPGVVSLQLNLAAEAPSSSQLANLGFANEIQWLTANLDSELFRNYKRIQLATTLTQGSSPWMSGYAATAFTSDYGKTQDFRKLVERARELGKEIVYDFVGGHTDGSRNPLPRRAYLSAKLDDGTIGIVGTWGWKIDDQNPEAIGHLLWWLKAVGIDSVRADVGGSIAQSVFLQRRRMNPSGTLIVEERDLAHQAAFDELYFEDLYEILENVGPSDRPIDFIHLENLLNYKLYGVRKGKRLLMVWNNHDKSQYHGGMGAFVKGLSEDEAQKKLRALYSAYIILHLTHLNSTSILEYSPDRFGFRGHTSFMYGRPDSSNWNLRGDGEFRNIHDQLLQWANSAAKNSKAAKEIVTNNSYVGAAIIYTDDGQKLLVSNISPDVREVSFNASEKLFKFRLRPYEVVTQDIPSSSGARIATISKSVSLLQSQEKILGRFIRENLAAAKKITWELAQLKQRSSFPVLSNSRKDSALLYVETNSSGDAELRGFGSSQPLLAVTRHEYQVLKNKTKHPDQNVGSLRTLSAGIEGRFNAALDQVVVDHQKRVVLELNTAWLDSVSEDYFKEFMLYWKSEMKKEYGKNVCLTLVGRRARSWKLLFPGIFADSIPESFANAQVVKIAPPRKKAGTGKNRYLPVSRLRPGDIPSFNDIRLAIYLGRLESIENRPEVFDDAYATLAGVRPERSLLTLILSQRADRKTLFYYRLRALIHVDEEAALRFVANMCRMYEQAA